MKTTRQFFALILSLLLMFSLTPAACAAEVPVYASSTNHGAENYVRTASPIHSYLYAGENDTLTRVEYIDGQIIIEDYDTDSHLLRTRTIAGELERFGGFYYGKTYNYLIFGQDNQEENDNREVYRVVQYDKDWRRLDQASLFGANTTIPFDAGTLRCAEAGDYLYIRTCHEMYTSSDGLNHQANLTITIRQHDMTLTDAFYRVWNVDGGYVSHSFNQFILADSMGNLVTLDHGDAGSTRSAVLCRYDDCAGVAELPYRNVPHVALVEFPETTTKHYNFTGAGLGGFAESSTHYLAVGNVDAQDGSASEIRNAAIWAIEKDLQSEPEQILLTTEYTDANALGNLTASVPQLVKFSDTMFLAVWEVCERQQESAYATPVSTGELHYVFLNNSGHPISGVFTAQGMLSDCAPILVNDTAVWYATAGGAPVFYNIDRYANFSSSRTASSFPDLALEHWASNAVERMVEKGIVNGYDDGNFYPEESVSIAQFSKMMVMAFYAQDVAGINWTPWWWGYLESADRHGLLENTIGLQGVDFVTSKYYGQNNVDDPLKRYDMAQMMYNLLWNKGVQLPEGQSSAIGDWDQIPQQYRMAVSVCYAAGLLNGIDGAFRGDQTMTRAQACTVLDRLLQAG